jgi:5-methylcytosine-specific restriction endonuclease McrA
VRAPPISHADRDPRRRFSARERAALLIAAAGRCAECSEVLDAGFHADHAEPWALGGMTDVRNGQALCPTCNRAKATRSASPPPSPTARPDQTDEHRTADASPARARRHITACAPSPDHAGIADTHDLSKEPLP